MYKIRGISIGTASVLLVVILLFASHLLGLKYPDLKFIRTVLLGGFIGGFTNAVAIRMMFRKYWYLPGSGVMLRKREDIINSLAETVEEHVINPEMLKDKLRRAIEKVGTDKIKDALNAVIDEFRADMLEYINSRSTHTKVVNILKDKLGMTGRLINIIGIKDFDVMAHQILDYLDRQVEKLRVTDSTINVVISKTGTLEDFIFMPDNPLLMKHYSSHESVASLMLDKFNTKQIVIDKLSGYPAEKVRDIIEANMKEHLGWLEVFGVILGMFFSGLFIFLR